MTDKPKQSRWAKQLEMAGLLDDIEDGWTLEDGEAKPGSTIKVEGQHKDDPKAKPGSPKTGKSTQPMFHDASKESIPAVLKAPSEPEGEATPLVDPFRQPAPKTKSSEPAGRAWGSDYKDAPRALDEPGERDRGRERKSYPDSLHGTDDTREYTPVAQVRDRRISIQSLDDDAQRTPVASISDDPPQAEPYPYTERGIEASRIGEEPQLGTPTLDPEPVTDEARELSARLNANEGMQTEMSELFEMGDYTGALEIAEHILTTTPDNATAKRYQETCREVLTEMYEARIGSLDHSPTIAISTQDIIWRNLDPHAGYILSRIDGMCTFEEIIDISGLGRFETCQILGQLLHEGIIK